MARATSVIAAIGTLLAVGYLAEGLRYPRGTLAQPGPGVFPLIVGILLLVSSIGTGLEVANQRPQEQIEWPDSVSRTRLVVIVLAIFGYIILLPYLGHPVLGSLLTLAMLHIMGMASWPFKIGIALAVGLGSYYLLTVLLGYPLPMGSWLGY